MMKQQFATPAHPQLHRAHAGFSFLEMLVTVAVISVLLSITVPQVGRLLDEAAQRAEYATLLEIQTALAQITTRYGVLPRADASLNDFCAADLDENGSTEWFECIAANSRLSQQEVALDVWTNPRVYTVSMGQTLPFMDTTLLVEYAAIWSMGADFVANDVATDGALVDGIAITTGARPEFAALTDSNWWQNAGSAAQIQQQFEELAPGDGDFLLKFSTAQQQVMNYHTTQKRLAEISRALAAFEQNQRAQEVALLAAQAATDAAYAETAYLADLDALNYFIFYPPARTPGMPRVLFAPGAQAAVLNQAALAGVEIYNGNNLELRRDGMVALMRVLGLPDEYCCNAMRRSYWRDSSVNPEQQEPMYYYANPLLRDTTTGNCQPQSSRPLDPPFNPPLVTINPGCP